MLLMDTVFVRVEFPPALLTRELAAYYLSISLRELDLLRNRNELVAVGTKGRLRYRKSDLDAWVERLPERLPRWYLEHS